MTPAPDRDPAGGRTPAGDGWEIARRRLRDASTPLLDAMEANG